MKACSHYRDGKYDTEIVESNGYPWNAVLNAWDGYKLISSEFRAGLKWDYLYHLRDNKECRKAVKITKKEVVRELRLLDRAWEALQ